MTVSLWIRVSIKGKRTYEKPNRKKVYPEGTVFCLRYAVGGKRSGGTACAQRHIGGRVVASVAVFLEHRLSGR
jgi:hypothetical protein